MVEVLRPSFLVEADGLQRRGVAARDAHLAPRRRDAQPGDAPERLVVLHSHSHGGAEVEAGLFFPLTPDAVQVEVPTAAHATGHDDRRFLREWCRKRVMSVE